MEEFSRVLALVHFLILQKILVLPLWGILFWTLLLDS